MGELADCERIVQEAIDGLGGLDIIISNAVGSAVCISGPCDGKNNKCCILMVSSDIQRAGQNLRISVTSTLSMKPNGTRY